MGSRARVQMGSKCLSARDFSIGFPNGGLPRRAIWVAQGWHKMPAPHSDPRDVAVLRHIWPLPFTRR
jgi:hypothetical protein